jgi:Phage XkdN-like tail assembly chaperone protein, TAC
VTFEPAPERHVVVEVLPDHANGIEPGAIAVPPAGLLPTMRPQDLRPDELRRGEGDVIDDLFRSEERSKHQVGTVELPRIQVRQLDDDGQPLRDADGGLVMGPLKFRLRPLRQSQIDAEARKCARVWQVGDTGDRENAPDGTELSARLVALSLVPEDRTRYLEDKRMWDHFGAGGPIDVLDRWLTAGELQQAGAMVMRMSGLRVDPRLERFLSSASSAAGADSPG